MHRPNFDQYRDQLRDVLSNRQPNTFPRHGPAAIDVADIFEQVNMDGSRVRTLTIQRTCSRCNQPSPALSLCLPTVIHPTMLPCSPDHQVTIPTPLTIQEWVDTLITTNTNFYGSGYDCHTCSVSTQVASSFQPTPFLHFEVPTEITSTISPSQILIICNANVISDHYLLREIIYLGQLHFTARLITPNNTAWAYDGQVNMGIPIKDLCAINNIHQLKTFQGKQAYVYVYQYIPHPPPQI